MKTGSNNKFILSLVVLCSIGLSACSAIPVNENARHIEIVDQSYNTSNCQYRGEVVGSQGNWVTGDYTSNENLIIGARNDMKNKAYELGANIIVIQNMSNSSAWGSLGTTNSTSIGKAYLCDLK